MRIDHGGTGLGCAHLFAVLENVDVARGSMNTVPAFARRRGAPVFAITLALSFMAFAGAALAWPSVRKESQHGRVVARKFLRARSNGR